MLPEQRELLPGLGNSARLRGITAQLSIAVSLLTLFAPSSAFAAENVQSDGVEKAKTEMARPAELAVEHPTDGEIPPLRPDLAMSAVRPEISWQTYVANSGGQAALNACSGGLTRITDRNYQRPQNKAYYALHRECGGTYLLNLEIGDVVAIDEQLYSVREIRDVRDTTGHWPLNEMKGSILLQTCYEASGMRRLATLGVR